MSETATHNGQEFQAAEYANTHEQRPVNEPGEYPDYQAILDYNDGIE